MPVTILIISWLPVKSWLVILDLPKWQFSFFGKKLKQWTHPFMGNFWYVYWSMKIIKKYYLPKYNFFWQIGIKAWLPITHRWVLLLASCSFICWSILLNILSIYYQSLTTHHKIVCLFFSIHVCCQSLCSFRWLSSSVYLSSFSLKPIQYFFWPSSTINAYHKCSTSPLSFDICDGKVSRLWPTEPFIVTFIPAVAPINVLSLLLFHFFNNLFPQSPDFSTVGQHQAEWWFS